MSESIRRKIAALLNMTVSAGCSEGEALAAAAKAAELMREHGLSESDIVIGEATTRHTSKGRGARDALWRIVAYCTNTALIVTHRKGCAGSDLVFVGREPGPEIAAYLTTVLNRAMDTEIAAFKEEAFYRRRRNVTTRRAAVRDFTDGMVGRLARRLVELFRPSLDAEARAVAVAALDDRFPEAKTVKEYSVKAARFHQASLYGWTAGGRVNLAHGVNGGHDNPKALPGRHPATNIGE
ncbi:DUF2786 domain-containing protein [Rhodobacter sp. NTK016B]|uniref:DUF7168 domain-containing protein n=1 Tax=Rhodobacter sp. NTK016B TaxID=2759676 RepID=UPI001A8DD0F2|nr:DUF2786 domain-containing protein [Rhodobacter sp. NTK016B]MBN8294715.1 DUF2786 domain-containing protein [Rhodobacter sp. NTK016B]